MTMNMNVDPTIYKAAAVSLPGFADYVAALLYLPPNYGRCRTRLAAAAYRKGVIAGLQASNQPAPYKPEHSYPNFMHGTNYPGFCWNLGHADGARIRSLFVDPEKAATVYPSLLQSEYKALPLEIRAIIDNAGARDLGRFHTANGAAT